MAFVDHVGRVEVEQPDPFETVDRIQVAQQARQRTAFLPIDAIERRILRDQQQLLDAPSCERTGFADDRIARTAPILAAQRRDDAEGTFVVAAYRDFHVGVKARRGKQAWRLCVVNVGRQRQPMRRAGIGRRVCGPAQGRPRAVEGEAASRPRQSRRRSPHLPGPEHRVDFRDLRPSTRFAIAARPCSRSRSCWQAPSFLCWAISRMASTDSCLAESMKAQVLTMRTSASAGSCVSWWPPCCARPSITSESDQVFRATEGDHADFHLQISDSDFRFSDLNWDVRDSDTQTSTSDFRLERQPHGYKR